MAAARGVLQRNVPMLYTASRACLQHPDVAAYKANRDLIYKQLQHAVSGISNAAQATSSEDSSFSQSAGGGELAYALNNFDVSLWAIGCQCFSDLDRNSKLISCVSEKLAFSNTTETKLRIGLPLIEGSVLCEHCHFANEYFFCQLHWDRRHIAPCVEVLISTAKRVEHRALGSTCENLRAQSKF